MMMMRDWACNDNDVDNDASGKAGGCKNRSISMVIGSS